MIFPAINRCYKNSIIGTKPRIEVIENQEKDVRSENNSIGGETEKKYKKFNSIFWTAVLRIEWRQDFHSLYIF